MLQAHKVKVTRPSKKIRGGSHTLPSSSDFTEPKGAQSVRRHSFSSAEFMQDTSEVSRQNISKKSGGLSRRVAIIDPDLALRHKLTSEEGQLEEHPDFTPAQARKAAKREYNRRNAARTRIRLKFLFNEIQERCTAMSDELETLRADNKALKAELEQIQQAARKAGTCNDIHCRSTVTTPDQPVLYFPQNLTAVEARAILQQQQVLAPQWPVSSLRTEQLASLIETLRSTSSLQSGYALRQQLEDSLTHANSQGTTYSYSNVNLSGLGIGGSVLFPK